MKNYNFRSLFIILMKILRFFENFLKNFSNFSAKKFGPKLISMHLDGVRGRSLEASDFIKNSPKINGNIVFFEKFS